MSSSRSPLPGLLLLCAVSLGACGAPAPAPTTPEPSTAAAPDGPTGRLVIYSGRDEKFAQPLLDLVRDRHPGLELVIDYGKDPIYLDRLRAERDQPVADLLLTKDSGTISAAAADGLLAPVPAELLARVPARFRGDSDAWVALSARARVLVVRKGVSPAPTSILDLAHPDWAGRVARTVATNSSFVGGVAAALVDKGPEATEAWLRGLDANTKDGGVFPKHTPAVASVIDGKHDVALVNHYYAYRAVLGEDPDPTVTPAAAEAAMAAAPILVIAPDAASTGAMWNVTGGGIVAGAPNADGARAVLAVLLSDEGQRAYASTNREYPVVDGLPAAPGVAGSATFSWSNATLPQLSAQSADAAALIQKVGLQ